MRSGAVVSICAAVNVLSSPTLASVTLTLYAGLMLRNLRKPSVSRAVRSTRAADTRSEMISGHLLVETFASAFLRLAEWKKDSESSPWISPRAAFWTGSLADLLAALWSTSAEITTVAIAKSTRIRRSGGPLPPSSCAPAAAVDGLVDAPTSDCGGGCSLSRPNIGSASHGAAPSRKPVRWSLREADRPARRDELGIVRRVLPARERDRARAARRPVVGRLPAALGRLRAGGAIAARGRLGGGGG